MYLQLVNLFLSSRICLFVQICLSWNGWGTTSSHFPSRSFFPTIKKYFETTAPPTPHPPHNQIVLYTQFLICIFKIKEYVLQVKTKAPKIEEKHLESGLHSAQTLKIMKMYRVFKKNGPTGAVVRASPSYKNAQRL